MIDYRQAAETRPYGEAWEHLEDELARFDIFVEAGFESLTVPLEDSAMDSFRGLVVTEFEARSLLTGDLRFIQMTAEHTRRLEEWEIRIACRKKASLEQGVELPLLQLQRRFRLSDWQMLCFAAALAPELNRKYEKLFAYLQDDMTCKFPSVDLLLKLLCRSDLERRDAALALLPSSEFVKTFFRRESGPDGSPRSALSRPLRVDDRMAAYAQGHPWRFEDGPLARLAVFEDAGSTTPPPILYNHELQELLHIHNEKYSQSNSGPTVYFLSGPPGSGKTLHARHTSAKLRNRLIEWDVSASPSDEPSFLEYVDKVLREAVLQDAVPAFDRLHELLGDEARDRRLEWLAGRLGSWTGPVFLFSEKGWKPARPIAGMSWIDVPLKPPDAEVRQRIWMRLADGKFALTEAGAGELAAKFRFTPGRIAATIDNAEKLYGWEAGREVTERAAVLPPALLHRVGYLQVRHRLSERAVKIEPIFGWDDLILPEETKALLRQACLRLQYRHIVFGQWGFERKLAYGKGISMLFTGPPGTGKTMSAAVMAREMDAELYRIDLSRIVSKYIGETEKNLGEIFEEAQLSGAILFFDEADALFGKRSEVKDAHDKYANMETSYLLQKMEEYDGLTILATNFAQNLDDAFMRRIGFIVKYPFPDPVQREQLWRSTFPKEMPVGEDVDFPFLAAAFDLAGGPIKNVVLTAAFMAAEEGATVCMRHMLDAVKQEYKKTGKVLLKERLGIYADK